MVDDTWTKYDELLCKWHKKRDSRCFNSIKFNVGEFIPVLNCYQLKDTSICDGFNSLIKLGFATDEKRSEKVTTKKMSNFSFMSTNMRKEEIG